MTKYDEAINAGLNHEDIITRLNSSEKFKAAIDQGLSEEDIYSRFGVPSEPATQTPAPVAVVEPTTPAPANEEKGILSKVWDTFSAISEGTNLASKTYSKIKEWWNDDESIKHESKIDNEFRHKVSSFSNPKDGTLVGMAGELLDNEYLKEKGKRVFTEQDVEMYKQNVLDAAGDKYEVEFDEKSGLPSARLKGTNDKFEPVLNDVFDASAEELESRFSANSARLAAEVGLDIAAGVAFDRKVGKHIKHPALRFIADGTASIAASIPVGALGSAVQTIDSGENITTDRFIEKTKEEMADNFLATTAMFKAIGVLTVAYKGAKAIKPHHSVKEGKDLHLDKDLYENQQVNMFSGAEKRELREEQLETQAKQRAETEDIYKDFGGIEKESEVLELVGQSNVKDILGDHYLHNQKMKARSIENSAQLTKNVKAKFRLDDSSSGDLYRIFRDGTKRAKAFHDNYYDEAKEIIGKEIGEKLVKVSSDTKATIEELLIVAKHPSNVQNTLIEEPVKNEFNKDYQELLNLSNSYFADTNGFTINKLFEFQKTFNQFTRKHNEKFTFEQQENLGKIKTAIYRDIKKGIVENVKDERIQKDMVQLWGSANKQYGKFKKLLERHDIFRNLLDPKYKFDVGEFTQTVFKDINKIDHSDINILAVFAKEIRATQGRDALDEFYSAIIDGLFKGKVVKGFEGEKAEGLFKTVAHKNSEYEVLDFDAFHKMFNSIDEKQLKKIFNQSKRGRELYYHLKNFDKLAQKEATANLKLFTKEFSMSDTAMKQHDYGKLFYSLAYGAKAMLWDSWSKYFMRSKAYETFMIRALSKPRYEDISNAIKKLDYDQRKDNIPLMQRVDTQKLKQDLENLKKVTKQAEEFITKNPEATKEELEEIVISGLIEHKHTFSGRNFDNEKIQAREMAKAEGMPQDSIERINNFDDLGRELKSFKEAIHETFVAHKKNPPVKESEEVLIHPEPVKSEPTPEPTIEPKATKELEIEKEDFKKFLVESGVKKEDGSTEPVQMDMMSQALNKQKFMSELEARVYNEPPLKEISQDAKLEYKRFEKMFTTFQGGKRELSAIVPQYTAKAFTKEQRENITVINDYFGGGGTWGAFFGRLENQFPNVKEIKIHEFNELRAMKINYLHHRPQALIDTLQNDSFLKELLEGMRALSIEKGDKGSHGFISPYINNMLEQYKQGKIPTELTNDQLAALYLVADYAARSVKEVDSTLKYLVEQVKGVAMQSARLKEKGIDIKVFNHSSYDDIVEYEQGSHVLSMIDPPYYKTDGYDIFDGDRLRKAEMVNVDIYEKTAKLIKDIKEAGNLGIYTDEAWEVKSIKLPKSFKNVTDNGVSDYELLKDISDNIEYFFRVPEKISQHNGSGGRTEVLGLINAKLVNSDLAEQEISIKGKIDDRYTSSRPNGANSNNDRAETFDGSNPRSTEQTPRGVERPDQKASENSPATPQGKDARTDGADGSGRSQEVAGESRVKQLEEIKENFSEYEDLVTKEQLNAILYDIKKHGKIARPTKELTEKYENIYQQLITHPQTINGHFIDNLLAGTVAGVETDEDGNITGFDPEMFVVGLGGYSVAKAGAKYIIKEYKPQQKIADKIGEFIDHAEDEMAKAAGGGKPPVSAGAVDADGFYSVLERVVDEKVGGKIDSVSLTKMLEKNGVKQDEIEWSGLGELMEKYNKLSKEQIEETIKENRLVIEKVNKAGNRSAVEEDIAEDMFFADFVHHIEITEAQGDILEAHAKAQSHISEPLIESGLVKEWDNLGEEAQGEIMDAWGRYKDVFAGEGKYGEYTLPMGDNYRELLFRKPDEKTLEKLYGRLEDVEDFTKEGSLLNAIKRVNKEQYRSSHWEEGNILVFTRVDDRAIDEKTTLFLEELQSDWHQAGRKEGYKKDGVPDAPFKKNWVELGLKRMIQEAVANDYEKLAWTTGQQQVVRNSLEKEIDTIVYNKATGYIQGTKDGKEVVFKKVASEEEIRAMLGKENTKKLIDPKSNTRDEIYVLQGDELRFGGEGMKTFYDKIVPNAVKKLFKKYKVKPKMEELDELEEMVWSVDITPQMKEDIKKYGQPLYMVGGTIVGLEAIKDGEQDER